MMHSRRSTPTRTFKRILYAGVAGVLVIVLGTWAYAGTRLLEDVREQTDSELRALTSLQLLSHAQIDLRDIRDSVQEREAAAHAIEALVEAIDEAIENSPAAASSAVDVVRLALVDLLDELGGAATDAERDGYLDELDLRLEQLLRLETLAVRDGQETTEQRFVQGLLTASLITAGAVLAFVLLAAFAMTAMRKAEAALIASEERWRSTFDAAATGVFVIDFDGGAFITANPAGLAMLGYTEEQVPDLSLLEIVHVDDVRHVRRQVFRLVSGRVGSVATRARYKGSDGRYGHALISMALVPGSVGGPLHGVAHAVDVTDQVTAERRLNDLLENKDELIASVSHELRTPLTAVVGYAEMLRDAHADLSPEDRREAIDRIASEGRDLADIVEDLLVAARADAGSLAVSQVPVDLRIEAEQVLEGLRHDADHKPVRVVGRSVDALGDPVRIRQIIRNLITNAFRYGGDEIRLSLDQRFSSVLLQVADDGPGVPEPSEEQIFESYGRAHARSGLTASIGLGLTVSRLLARLMGGDLTYRREGGVAIFELDLPAASRPAVEFGETEPMEGADQLGVGRDVEATLQRS